MKKILLGLFLLPFCVPTQAAEIHINGQLAMDLYDYGASLGASDAGMGHIDLEMYDVDCSKTLDGNGGGEVKCSSRPGSRDANFATVSTKDNDAASANAAKGIRNILKETTKADKKISKLKRELKVRSIECEGLSPGHDFDMLDEDGYISCVVNF